LKEGDVVNFNPDPPKAEGKAEGKPEGKSEGKSGADTKDKPAAAKDKP